MQQWAAIEAGGVENVNKATKLVLRDCLRRVSDATWWEWKGGSTLFFWRWPKHIQREAEEGMAPWFVKRMKPWKRRQPRETDPRVRELVSEKLANVRSKRYIAPGEVKSLTSYFSVPKGADDIRMVYDGTKCGLNDVLWAPWFQLPTIQTALRAVMAGTFMCDNDSGEMFLNFPLPLAIQLLCGVDLTQYFDDSEGGKLC